MVDDQLAARRLPVVLSRALAALLLLHVLGFVALFLSRARRLPDIDVGLTPHYNIFAVLFDSNEMLGLTLSVAVLLLAVVAARWRNLDVITRCASWHVGHRGFVWGLAAGACVVAWLGCHLVYLGFPLSMDEYGAEMQARIFASGLVSAPVPEQWLPYSKAMTPIFVTLTESGEWISFYLPVYALIRALFISVHPSLLLNPLLVGWCVLLVASVARQLWPQSREAPVLAALFLASSSQLLVNGMSFYTMPAHLALNLLWLHLYLRDTRWSWVGVAVVGVLAMGLHQFVMHPLFAAPFLLRLVLRRRWILSALLASVYSGGLYCWYLWMRIARTGLSNSDIAASWGFPLSGQNFNQMVNLVGIAAWQAPVVAVLALVAVMSIGRASDEVKDLLLSCLLTFGLYVFFLNSQGHGWGYRYFFPVLGNLMLLATVGWKILAERLEHRRLVAFVAVGLIGAVVVQLPNRLRQVRSFVAPFASADAFLRSRDAEIVLIDAEASWYARDLVRSDPLFLKGPVVMNTRRLTPGQHQILDASFRVELISPATLGERGMVTTTPTPEQLLWRNQVPDQWGTRAP